MQSTIIALAELLGPPPAQGLRRSQNVPLSSCPSSAPPPLLPDWRAFLHLPGPSTKERIGFPAWEPRHGWGRGGRWGRRDHSFLVVGPGPPYPPLQSRELLPALLQLPRGPARPSGPLWVFGPPEQELPHCVQACWMLAQDGSRTPCWSRDSMGTRKQQQSGPPGLPYPGFPGTLLFANVTPHSTIPRNCQKTQC